MPFNDTHLSNEILEWISTTPFEELSTDQQNKVLAVMTVDAYNELHLTNSLLIQQTELHDLSKNHLDHLLLAFDQHHHQPTSASLLSANWFWKIASICLLCSTLTLAYLHSTVRVNSQEIIVKHDTIYQTPYQHVSSSPSPETTPTLAPQPRTNSPKKSSIVSVRKNTNRSKQLSSVVNKASTTAHSRDEIALPVYASNRLFEVCNQSKGNRMKDDSLSQNFKYVSL